MLVLRETIRDIPTDIRLYIMEIINALNEISPLSHSSIKKLQQIVVQKNYAKGDHLLDLGHVNYHLHFIVRGSSRIYYLRDGRDISHYFALDKQFIGGLESLFTGKPSHKAIELTEDSTVQSFLYRDFEDLCDQHHDIERLGRKLAIFAFLDAQQLVENIRFLSAAERYQELEKRHPGISNRIPLKHLASYLNISPVSLSRIRSGKQ